MNKKAKSVLLVCLMSLLIITAVSIFVYAAPLFGSPPQINNTDQFYSPYEYINFSIVTITDGPDNTAEHVLVDLTSLNTSACDGTGHLNLTNTSSFGNPGDFVQWIGGCAVSTFFNPSIITPEPISVGNFTFVALNHTGGPNISTMQGQPILLHNLDVPPQQDPTNCSRFGPKTTNMSDPAVSDFVHVNYVVQMQVNFTCQTNGTYNGTIPGQFENVMLMNLTDVNMSDADIGDKLAHLKDAINVSIGHPRTFEPSRIDVNSSAFLALSPGNVTLFNLPFTSKPDVLNDSGEKLPNGVVHWDSAGYSSAKEASIGNLTFEIQHFSGYLAADQAKPLIALNAPIENSSNGVNVLVNVTVNGTGTELSFVTISLNASKSYTYNGSVQSSGSANCQNISADRETFNCLFYVNLSVEDYTLNVSACDFGGDNSSGPGKCNNSALGFSIIAATPVPTPSTNISSDSSSTSEWRMFGRTLDHNKYYPGSVNMTGFGQIWNFTTDGTVDSSPAIANGILYIGSDDNKLYALNASTGVNLWNYTTGDKIGWSSPAVADGIVYVGSNDKKLYALNASTGVNLWNYTTGDIIYSSPTVAGGIVYIGSNDNQTYALDAANGSLIWNYTTLASLLGGAISSPAVANGVVYIGSDDNIYALNATHGNKIWNYSTGFAVFSSPAIANTMVYFGSEGLIYALNATSGAQIWNYTTNTAYMWPSPAVANGVVYIGTPIGDGNVYALNATNGTIIWNYTTSNIWFSSPAVANGLVFIGADADPDGDGNARPGFYVLNSSNGNLIFNSSINMTIYSSPAIANGIVYIGSHDNKTYAFGPSNVAASDITYPVFSNYYDNNGTLIASGTGLFNVTLANTNGTVWMQINNTNITATNLTDGVYNVSYSFTAPGTYPYVWHSYGNGTSHNLNASGTGYYTVNATSTAPVVIIVYPSSNGQWFNINNPSINYTLSGTAAQACWYYNGTGNTTVGCVAGANNITKVWAQGNRTIIIYANDSTGLVGNATRNFMVDTIAPNVAINSPANNTWTASAGLTPNFNFSDSNGVGYCKAYYGIYLQSSGSVSNGTGTLLSGGLIPTPYYNNGSFAWYITCNDSAGNTNTSETRILYSDTASPTLSINSPASAYYTNNATVILNITPTDNLASNVTCGLHIDGALNKTVNVTNGTSYALSQVYTEATHAWYANCSDYAGNLNISDARNFTIDLTKPIINTSTIAASPISSSGATITWTTNKSTNSSVGYGTNASNFSSSAGTSTYSTSNSVALSGLSASTLYYYNVTSCDQAGNCATNGTYNFTTIAAAVEEEGDGGDGGGGGGGAGGGAEEVTYFANKANFEAGFTKELRAKDKIMFSVGNVTHRVTLMSMKATSVIINVSSKEQIATLNVGEEKKFELTDDNYYDLSVKLNSINLTTNKSSLTILAVHEIMPVVSEAAAGEEEAGAEVSKVSKIKYIIIAGIVVLIIVIIVVLIIRKKSQARHHYSR